MGITASKVEEIANQQPGQQESDPRPFPLLRLPLEFQQNVYRKYYEGTVLELCDCLGRLDCHDFPSLNLELTCREVHIEAKKVRTETFNHHLIVTGPSFLNNINDFVTPRFDWLRNHLHSIELIKPAVPIDEVPDWTILVDDCPKLKRLYLTICDRVCPEHDLPPGTSLLDRNGEYAVIVMSPILNGSVQNVLAPYDLQNLARALRLTGRLDVVVEALVSFRVESCAPESYKFTLDIMIRITEDTITFTAKVCSAGRMYSSWSLSSKQPTVTDREWQTMREQVEALKLSPKAQVYSTQWLFQRSGSRIVRQKQKEIAEPPMRRLGESQGQQARRFSAAVTRSIVRGGRLWKILCCRGTRSRATSADGW